MKFKKTDSQKAKTSSPSNSTRKLINPNSGPVRIQKLLSQAGIASRRDAENWIEQGRITVNGTLATLGDKATPTDKIVLDKQLLDLRQLQSEKQMFLYYKPTGEVVSRRDEKSRDTVFKHFPEGAWITVGRLDINSEGLLLVTNDGELAHRLMHPSYNISRVYRVRVFGRYQEEMSVNLLQGVQLDDGFAQFVSIVHRSSQGKNHWFDVSLAEGKTREVRRLWESQGMQVSRLIRTQYGSINLPEELKPGQTVFLNRGQMQQLYRQVRLES